MPRSARFIWPGRPYHITQRGNNGQPVFHDPTFYEAYLHLLKESIPASATQILAYALMNNHIHIVAIPQYGDSLARLFRRLSGTYAQYLNVRTHATGKVWGNRYYSTVMSPRHYYHALRYVELNPVRAGLVSNPANYPWTSARAHYSGRDPLEILNMKVLDDFGGPEGWIRMVERSPDVENSDEIDHYLRTCTYSERPFGDESFLREAESHFGRVWRRWPFELSLDSTEVRLNLVKLSPAPAKSLTA